MSKFITLALLVHMEQDGATHRSSIETAKEALQLAQRAADAAAADDGSLSAEELLDQRTEANRRLELAKITLSRAETTLQHSQETFHGILADQCRIVTQELQRIAAAERDRVTAEIVAIVAPNAPGGRYEQALRDLLRCCPAITDREDIAGRLAGISRNLHFNLRPATVEVMTGVLRLAVPLLNPEPADA